MPKACPNCSYLVDVQAEYCPYCNAPTAPEYAVTASIDGVIPAISNQAVALMKRYRDAYYVANTTVAFGNGIKITGFVLAGLVFFGVLAIGEGGGSRAVLALLSAGLVGLLFYFLGVLVAAQGQILLASLDGAVNTSPFLTNEQRAEIMSLPKA